MPFAFINMAGRATSPNTAFTPMARPGARRSGTGGFHIPALSAITASISTSYPRIPAPTVVRAGIGS